MKKIIILFLLFSFDIQSQNANQIIKKSVQLFSQVKSYINDVKFQFEIPNINIKNIDGKAYYKAPNNYRIKTTQVAFIPNENPMKLYSFLRDSSYNAIYNSIETIQDQKCHLINIIPNRETYFILGKVWISSTNNCIYKIELTTQSGTIKLENFFRTMTKYGLPDKMIFYLDNFKFRPKKKMGVNQKDKKDEPTEEKTGKITLLYNNYQINVPVADSLFVQPKPKKKG